MALTLADRVKETTTTSGGGTVTLLGASTGYQSFAIVGNGNTTYYCIANQGTDEWEVGIGTYTASGTTLARTTVLSNSSATEPSALVFSAGIKDVFVTYPSEKSVNLDAAGDAVAFNGPYITGLPLASLATVDITSPAVNQLLGYNGTAWVNVAPNPASAGTGVVFYNATPVITAAGANSDVAILTFASIPVTTAEQVITGTAVSNTVLFSAFITVALNRLIFDAGIYDFTIWAGVDSIASSSVTTITRQIYTATPFVVGTVTTTGTGSSRTATASSGTPFATSVIDASATNTTASYLQTPQGLYQITARTSDTVVTITTPSGYTNESAVAGTVWKKLFGITTPEITSISPNYTDFGVITTQPSTVVTTATKMGILGFVTSDATRTISLTYNGEDRNTHVNTPLANLHNDLAGLQGGSATEYFHSTSAEYTGTGTGVFVRKTNAALITPNLGTPSALVGTNITGTATAFTASNVTTNANLTGPITSVGNATSIASQTGSGSTFVVNTSPTLITPALGAATATTITMSGLITGQPSTATDVNTANDLGALSCRNNGGATTVASMSFHRTGSFGTNMGLGADNIFRLGGWSAPSNCLQVNMNTGAATFLGSVTSPQYFSLAGTASVAPQRFTAGTNLSTIVSGAAEYDGTNLYFTQNSAGKRGVINSSPQYVLSAAGAAIGPTIAPFFTSASTIPLLASSNYFIEAFCYFLKGAAGTAIWTHTLTAAAELMHTTLEITPITGFNAALITGAMLTTEATQRTVTTMALVATGSLTLNVYHLAKIKLNIRTTGAVNYTLNLTQSLGTATPQAGSWLKVTLVTGSTY